VWRALTTASATLLTVLTTACGSRQSTADAPVATQPPARTVLYIGTLDAAQVQRTLGTLNRELQRLSSTVGPVRVVHEHLGSGTATDNELLIKVKQAYADHHPNIVFAATPRVARLAQGLDTQTPIVFEGSADPRLNCLVDNLLRPGRNATGYTAYVPMAGKMLEALQLAFPAVQQVVILVDGKEREARACAAGQKVPLPPATCSPGWLDVEQLGQISPAAQEAVKAVQASGLGLRALRLCDATDFARLRDWLGARTAAQAPTMGLVVPMQYLYFAKTQELVTALKPLAWPAVYPRWRWAQLGGLMAVSPTPENYTAERATEVTVRLLDGAQAQETPVQFPDGLQWTFNAQTAHEQGLQPSNRALRRVYRFLP